MPRHNRMTCIAKSLARIAGVAFTLVYGGTAADSIDTAGQEPYEKCGYCHELDGNSRMEAAPRIAGQPLEYIVKQLRDFRSGRRVGTMQATAELLSDSDINVVARHFNAQAARVNVSVPLTAEEHRTAEQLHRQGDRMRGIIACVSCHGENGEGKDHSPRLAGQHAVYLESQLLRFKQGQRTNDADGIMRSIVSGASAHEIRSLARYFASLNRP